MPESGFASEKEGFFKTHDGLNLFYRHWDVSQPRAVCLLVHGLAEHSGRYGNLAGRLTAKGHSVWSMDHRGHGRSEGIRGDCRSLQEFVDDLHLLKQRAAEALPGLPLFVIGHSLGGLIALTYAVDHPQEIRGVAVSSPALKLTHETPAWKVALVTATAKIAPLAPFQNGVNPSNLCRDPQVVEAYRKDPLIHRVLTARCALALQDALRGSLELAGRLSVPCVIFQSGTDQVCDPEMAREFARRAVSSGVPLSLRRYDGMYHELFNEPERGRVIEDLCQWLDSILQN